MKKLVLIFMLFIPILLNAQSIRNSKTNQTTELKESVEMYSAVVFQLVGAKFGFYVMLEDLGAWDFIDSTGTKIEFKTVIAVMNYMYRNGWEYINNIGGSDGAAPQYFFRKKE